MLYLYRIAVAVLVSAFATINADAGIVIYQQLPGPNSNAGLDSSTRDALGNLPGFHVADDFVLSQTSKITDVHWWGIPSPAVPLPGGTDFQFIFYADNGGLPGAILHTTSGSLTTATVSVGSGFDPVTFYSSDLNSPFEATSGTNYWLSIFNQAPDASWEWLVANVPGDGSSQWINTGSPCCIGGQNMAFELTVPEPATFVLLGGALACFGLVMAVRRGKTLGRL